MADTVFKAPRNIRKYIWKIKYCRLEKLETMHDNGIRVSRKTHWKWFVIAWSSGGNRYLVYTLLVVYAKVWHSTLVSLSNTSHFNFITLTW